jgi:alpha-tubulin suppressor-like RCC1 family protein
MMSAALTSVVAVSASTDVQAVGGEVFSTGLNADGQLGNGTTQQRLTPGPVNIPTTVVAVASGREHAYALDDLGRVWAWGDNTFGAVGDGSSSDRPTPVLLGLTDVVQIEAGHYHGIALRRDGTVWTWGYGGLGQLGLGTTGNRNTPVQVPGLAGIIGVAAGRDMSYALRADHTVMAWGGNTFGEVGDGTTVRRTTPVPVIGLTDVEEISGGRNHALAVRADRSLWAWGANERSQLGIGTTVNRPTPVQVLAGSVLHVDAGAEHSVAVLTDGTVRSWGRGQRGQLGLGTTTNRTRPTVVPGLAGIVDVGDGRDQTFAITDDGRVWAWGFNDTGQLGDGSTTTRLSPVMIGGLSGITVVQGGRGMTIFLSGIDDSPDTNPPTVPGRPTATSTVAGQVDLTWPASSDDRASVLTYTLFRNDDVNPIGSTTGGTTGTISFSDENLVVGSSNTYRVSASDGVNQSALSDASDPVVVAGGGTQPTVLLDENFSAGLGGWTVSGALTVDSSSGSASPPSVRAAVSASVAEGRRSLTRPSSNACISFNVRVTSVSGTSGYALVKARDTSGSSVGRLEVGSSGQLTVRADVVGTRFTVTPRLPFGSWQRVSLCVVTGGAGSLRLDVNGVTLGTWNVSTGVLPVSIVQIGDNSARTATVNLDDVTVTETP